MEWWGDRKVWEEIWCERTRVVVESDRELRKRFWVKEN